jgi:CheY-like chemotaxis protein
MDPAEPQAVEVQGTVLCIEDQPVSMALVEAHLSTFPGVTLIKASTGREGVRLAQSQLPDLVLLDMHLPDIDGLEVVRALNETIAQRQLRVILLTADSFSIDVVKAMTLGAHAYWQKPLTFERLRVELPRALQFAQAERRRALARRASPP